MTFKVNGGDLFEGSLEHWEDCFFSFPDGLSEDEKFAAVCDFCKNNKYTVDKV